MATHKHNKPRGHNRTHVNQAPDPSIRYVVRDRDWERVWAVDLPLAEAHKLKEQIAGRHLSRSVRYEPMPTDPDELELCQDVRGIDAEAAPAEPKRRAPASPDARRPAAPPPRAAAAQPAPELEDSYEDDDADGDPDADLAAALGSGGNDIDDLIGGAGAPVVKVVDARSGDVLSVGSIVRYPDGESLRLDAVYEGLLVSRAMISTVTTVGDRRVADTRVVDLRVRYLHPAFLFQKVGFIES